MSDLYCMFWIPGSCGDIIQQLLGKSGQFENQYDGAILDTGRALQSVDPRLKNLFPSNIVTWTPKNTNRWYGRTWNDSDILKLKELAAESSQSWIIGTHRLDQLFFLKKSLDIVSIGITYDIALYPAVIKNWCRKSAVGCTVTQEIYKNSKIAQKFQEKNLFGEFMLKEILNHITDRPKKIDNNFDINISLGDIYNRNLSSIDRWVTDAGLDIFDRWLLLQDPLYRFKYTNHQSYIDILGYNTHATTVLDDPIKLSTLDQILISHYCKDAPSTINTNIDFVNFLNGQG